MRVSWSVPVADVYAANTRPSGSTRDRDTKLILELVSDDDGRNFESPGGALDINC